MQQSPPCLANYDSSTTEAKWQKYWEDNRVYRRPKSWRRTLPIVIPHESSLAACTWVVLSGIVIDTSIATTKRI